MPQTLPDILYYCLLAVLFLWMGLGAIAGFFELWDPRGKHRRRWRQQRRTYVVRPDESMNEFFERISDAESARTQTDADRA